MQNLGKWDYIGYNMFMCPKCGEMYDQTQFKTIQNHKAEFYYPDYCPNCGNHMDNTEDKESPTQWKLFSEETPSPYTPLWISIKRFGVDELKVIDGFLFEDSVEKNYVGVGVYNVCSKTYHDLDKCVAWMPYFTPEVYKGKIE